MKKTFLRFFSWRGGGRHKPHFGGLEILKYIGPGLLVTVGFIDPGNWASNLAAGAGYGYSLLWMVSLATLMLIILQHNAAHLGIASGLCLAEAAMRHLPRPVAVPVLLSAVGASMATSLAEVLGSAIALHMLFKLPIAAGAWLTVAVIVALLLTNSYKKVERWIIAFVSVIGVSFLYEIYLVPVDWPAAAKGWVAPDFPAGSMLIIMSVLGAVVMPHNLFLHSEVIQSRQWHLEDEAIIKKQLDYEFFDTLFSMLVGWAINSAMILLAAGTFFAAGQAVTELEQAKELLRPLLGANASTVFAVALLMAGMASTVTSGMAAGSIVAGMFGEPYDMRDSHTKMGVILSLAGAALIISFLDNSFQGLLVSQMLLSVQLPITMITQIWLTSSKKVMGRHANGPFTKSSLIVLAVVVGVLNVLLFASFFQ